MSDAGRSGAIPPSWLNKDFIEKILRVGEKDPTITVTSHEVKLANAVGYGYASDMYRIIVKVEDSRERRMVVKCLPQEGTIVEAIRSDGAFQKETVMLAETLPAMYSLLDRARPGEFQPFAAKYLYHDTEPTDFIVLEDLRESGFTMAKRQLGLDLAHCKLVIQTLARYHASSVALRDRDPEIVSRYGKPAFKEETRKYLGRFVTNAVRCLAAEVSKWPGYEKYMVKLNNLEKDIFDRMIRVCERKDDEFNVLTHNDPWSGNMMFKYSGEIPQCMRLVDFQLPYFCSPALDLQYFLNSCPNMDVRMNHMESLLLEYHKTLTEILHILSCSKYAISFLQFKEMFRNYSLYGFYSACSVMPIALSDPENSFDVEEAMGDGHASEEKNSRMYSNPAYIQAMKYLLPLFDEDGIFD